MRALVLDRPGSFRVAEVPDPTPRPTEIVVKVDCCGICGTDMHILAGEFPPTPTRIIPGHEFAGQVVARGADVAQDLPDGTRVAVDPSLFCGWCRRCRAGRGNLCENWGAIGDTTNGAFAEYVAVPAVNAYRLPDHLGGQYGAMAEPLSCAVHGVRRLGPVAGDAAVVWGPAPWACCSCSCCCMPGRARLPSWTGSPARLDVARRLGAAQAVTDADALDGARFAVAVDATGVAGAIETAIGLLERGGRMLVFGVAPADATISVSPFRVYNDELTIVGSMAVLRSFGQAVDLLASGAVDPGPLLGEPLPLEGFGAAVEPRTRRSGDQMAHPAADRQRPGRAARCRLGASTSSLIRAAASPRSRAAGRSTRPGPSAGWAWHPLSLAACRGTASVPSCRPASTGTASRWQCRS